MSEPHRRLLDEPIANAKGDRLKFSQLSSALANAINGHPNSSSLVLGLDGPWGSGKSSIINLLQSEFETRGQQQASPGVGLTVVSFSPWLITNRTAMISALFGQLGRALIKAARKAYPVWNLRKLHKRLEIESLRIDLHKFGSIVAVGSNATMVLDPSLTSAALASGSNAIQQLTEPAKSTLQKRKQALNRRLKQVAEADSTFRILVLIDDLDRLDPHDAIEVLRLVKAVADFPGVMYLLAYDRNALADAIERNRQVSDGNAYMEKILQFSFKVPPLEPFRLRQWLRHEIEKLFPNEVEYETERAQAVLDVWAGRLLNTPRDVKRLLFAVYVIWNDLKSRVDLLDLIWLQMVKEKAGFSNADLYSWVTRYLQSLDAIAIGGMISGQRKESDDLSKILNDLGWQYRTGSDDGSSMDLHYLDKILTGVTQSYLIPSSENSKAWTHNVSSDELQEFRAEKRLSSPWHWRLYFAMEPPSHAITDDEWSALLQAVNKSSADLRRSILTLMEHGREDRRDLSDQLMDRIGHLSRVGNLDKPRNWILVAYQIADQLRRYSKSLPLSGSVKVFDRKVHVMMKGLFHQLSEDDRREVIQALFEESSNLSLSADLLCEQFVASKAGGARAHEKLYLTESELTRAVAGQLSLYTALDVQAFLELSDPYAILYSWREITGSSDGASDLVSQAINTDEGLLNTLSALKLSTSNEQQTTYFIPEESFSAFVDTNAVKSRLHSLSKSGSEYSTQASKLLSIWSARRT